jgi:hypothetical protein
MGILERFMAYAQDFETTFRDDDWSRLEQHFTPDAIYEIRGKPPFACSLKGPTAIFRGIKKSLDGFDRRFATRDVAVTAPPEVEGDTMRVSWTVTYGRDGSPPLVLRGRSEARYAGDRIIALTDSYTDEHVDEVGAWMQEHGKGLDPSYT